MQQIIRIFTGVLLLLLQSPIAVFSKPDFFEKAVLITKGNTERLGEIKFENEYQFDKPIVFKSVGSDEEVTFPTEDVVSILLLKDSIYFKNVEFYHGGVKDTMRKIVKQLLNGPVKLYHVPENVWNITSDAGFQYYYVIQKGGEAYALLHNRLPNSKYYNKYKGILMVFMKDCTSILGSINSVGYNKFSLLKLINRYNSCINPEEKSEVYNVNSKSVFSDQILLGLGYVNRFRSYSVFENGFGGSIGYRFNIQQPSISKRATISVGAEYLFFSFRKTEYRHNSESNSLWELRAPLIGNYDIVQSKDKLKRLTFSSGLMAAYSSKLGLTPYIAAGLSYRYKVFSIGIWHENNFIFSPKTASFGGNINQVRLGLNF